MLDFVMKGGPVMVPIVLCSVVVLLTLLERLWALRRSRIVPDRFCEVVLDHLAQGRLDDALALAQRQPSAVARIVAGALEARDAPREALKERVEEVGRREAAEMERFTPILGTCASIGPLLGLLGTVQGMIETFAVIERGGMGDMSSLAGGISVALITTFAGLCVGIPALVADRFVLARVDRLALELEEVAGEVVERLAPRAGWP